MRIPKDSWLFNTPIAHRGLWNEQIPENTMPAFENAINHGFAIEIDVYITTDDEIVVIHDDELSRLTGVSGKPNEKSLAELKSLRILGTDNQIPTLKELLKVVDGKVPLLIEIKPTQRMEVVDKTVEILKDYTGDFAIQSFNPKKLLRVKKLAPEFIRGVLGMPQLFPMKKFDLFIVKKMPLNFLIKPDFISYYHGAYPLKKCKTKNKLLLAWTITNEQIAEQALQFADNIIFENFIPKK